MPPVGPEAKKYYSQLDVQNQVTVAGTEDVFELQKLALNFAEIGFSSNLPVSVGITNQPDFTTGSALTLPRGVSLLKYSPLTRSGLQDRQKAGFYAPFGIRFEVNANLYIFVISSSKDSEIPVAVGYNPFHRTSTDYDALTHETSLVIGALITLNEEQIKDVQSKGLVILPPKTERNQTYRAGAFAVPKSAIKPEVGNRFKGLDGALFIIDPYMLRPNVMQSEQNPLPFVENFAPVAVVNGEFGL